MALGHAEGRCRHSMHITSAWMGSVRPRRRWGGAARRGGSAADDRTSTAARTAAEIYGVTFRAHCAPCVGGTYPQLTQPSQARRAVVVSRAGNQVGDSTGIDEGASGEAVARVGWGSTRLGGNGGAFWRESKFGICTGTGKLRYNKRFPGLSANYSHRRSQVRT